MIQLAPVILRRVHALRFRGSSGELSHETVAPGAFRSEDEVDAVFAVDIHGEGEHPHLESGGGGDGLGDPGLGIEIAGLIRSPVDVDGAIFAFGGGDDVELAIVIEVGEDGIFDALGVADGDGGPRGFGLFGAGVEVDADGAAFFPACCDIHEAIVIGIGEADAVGPAFTGGYIGAVDGMAFPCGAGVGKSEAGGKE